MGASLLSPRGRVTITPSGEGGVIYISTSRKLGFSTGSSRGSSPGAPGAPGALERLNSPLLNSPIWLIFLHCQAGHVAGETSDFASIAPSGSNKRAFPRQQIKQRGRSALKGKYSNGWKNEEENGAAYRNRTD